MMAGTLDLLSGNPRFRRFWLGLIAASAAVMSIPGVLGLSIRDLRMAARQ